MFAQDAGMCLLVVSTRAGSLNTSISVPAVLSAGLMLMVGYTHSRIKERMGCCTLLPFDLTSGKPTTLGGLWTVVDRIWSYVRETCSHEGRISRQRFQPLGFIKMVKCKLCWPPVTVGCLSLPIFFSTNRVRQQGAPLLESGWEPNPAVEKKRGALKGKLGIAQLRKNHGTIGIFLELYIVLRETSIALLKLSAMCPLRTWMRPPSQGLHHLVVVDRSDVQWRSGQCRSHLWGQTPWCLQDKREVQTSSVQPWTMTDAYHCFTSPLVKTKVPSTFPLPCQLGCCNPQTPLRTMTLGSESTNHHPGSDKA